MEKSKKELEAKATVIAEKAKEKQKVENKEKTNTVEEVLDEEKEIVFVLKYSKEDNNTNTITQSNNQIKGENNGKNSN